jgi:hypothetical protein
MALIESLNDPALTVGLSFTPIYSKIESGGWPEVLHWSQRVIDLAGGDPTKGNFIFGSPLALAFASRGMGRYNLGRPGWRDDLQDGLAMARSADPTSYASVVGWVYNPTIVFGVLAADESALREIEDALRTAERSVDDFALWNARLTLGLALVHQDTSAERDRGEQLLAEVCDVFVSRGYNLCELPIARVYLARERAKRGERDDAIALLRAVLDDVVREGQLLGWGIPATGALVETLLDRGADADIAEADAAAQRLATAPTDDDVFSRDFLLMRLRALLAKARGDGAAYTDLRDRYRDMAKSLGFEGHIAWAEAMP